MPNKTCVPDKLTAVEELNNIVSFARVILAINKAKSPNTPDWCDSIIRAAHRVRNVFEEPC